MKTFVGAYDKLNFKAGGTAGVPTGFTECGAARDVTVSVEMGEADVTTRASAGWENTEPALKKMSINFELLYDPDDAGFAALEAAVQSRAVIGLQAVDADGKGVMGDFKIFSWVKTEALDGADVYAVTCKVARSANPPEWVEPSP
jgi:hypothetical protein